MAHIKISRDWFILFLLAWVLFIHIFVDPEGGIDGITLLFAGVALYVWVVSHSSVPRMTWYILVAFLAWALVETLFFSRVPYTSFQNFLSLLAGALVFSVGFPEHLVRRAAVILVVGALLLVMVGLVMFLFIPQYQSARFTSIFYQHNAFAGFLIVPLMLSFWLVLEKKQYGYLLAGISTFILWGGLALTFSRGGYLSVAAAIAVFIFFLRKNSVSFARFGKQSVVILLLVALGAGAGFGLFEFLQAHARAQGISAPASPYELEQSGQTGFHARLVYMKYGLKLFKERPLVGYGLGSYGTESARVLDEVIYFSMDPHNLYLRFLAELGILGGTLFIIFVFLVLWTAFSAKLDLLHGALLAGFVGMLIHNGVDLDFFFPANVMLFFTVACLLVRHDTDTIKVSRVLKMSAILAAAAIFPLFVSDKLFDRAWIYALAQGNVEPYETHIRWSLALDPFNPFIRIQLSGYYLERNELDRAEQLLDEVRRIHPNNRSQYLQRGLLLVRRGEDGEAEAAYKRALELAPYRDVEPVIALVDLYQKQGRSEEVRNLIKDTFKRFPPEAFKSSIWINPEKQDLLNQLIFLERILNELPQ